MATERAAQHRRLVYREAGPTAAASKFTNQLAAGGDPARLSPLVNSTGGWRAMRASAPENAVLGWLAPDEIAVAIADAKSLSSRALDQEGTAGLAALENSGRPLIDAGTDVPVIAIAALLERIQAAPGGPDTL